jgi:hypothetical protein
LYVAARTIVYNPGAGEATSIALPLDTSPARFEQAVLAAGATSFAATLSDGDDVYLYRWASVAPLPRRLLRIHMSPGVSFSQRTGAAVVRW